MRSEPGTGILPAAAIAVGQQERAQFRHPASNAARAWRRFRANTLAIAALVIALLLVAMAVGAPLISRAITHVGPTQQHLIANFEPASRAHWFGTDEYGRDVLTRIAYGGRASLGVGFLAVLINLLVGTFVGIAAAYYGGWVDNALMRFVDAMLSIPTIFLLILIGSLIRFQPPTLALAIALFSWFGYSRLVRAEILSIKQREYVEAARVIGASDRAIIMRHILPNVMHLVIVFATIGFPGFILAEAGLSYLGLGIQPPTASWGNMLINATQYLYQSKGLIFIPGMFIWITVLSLTIVGNALRDALDPRLTD